MLNLTTILLLAILTLLIVHQTTSQTLPDRVTVDSLFNDDGDDIIVGAAALKLELELELQPLKQLLALRLGRIRNNERRLRSDRLRVVDGIEREVSSRSVQNKGELEYNSDKTDILLNEVDASIAGIATGGASTTRLDELLTRRTATAAIVNSFITNAQSDQEAASESIGRIIENLPRLNRQVEQVTEEIEWLEREIERLETLVTMEALRRTGVTGGL